MNAEKKLNDFITEAMSVCNTDYQNEGTFKALKTHRERCADAINTGFTKHYNGTRLDCTFIQSIIRQFGYKTVCWIFAYAIQERIYDNRINQDNKEWAYNQHIFFGRRSTISLNTHSGLIDLMCNYLRELENTEIMDFRNDLTDFVCKYDSYYAVKFNEIRVFHRVYDIDDLLLLRRYAPFYNYLTTFIEDCDFIPQPLNNDCKVHLQNAANEAKALLERLKTLPAQFGCVLKVCHYFGMYYDYFHIYNKNAQYVKKVLTDFLEKNKDDDITPNCVRLFLTKANCKLAWVGSSELNFTKDYPADLELCFDTMDIVDLHDNQEQ